MDRCFTLHSQGVEQQPANMLGLYDMYDVSALLLLAHRGHDNPLLRRIGRAKRTPVHR